MLRGHPYIERVFAWDKRTSSIGSLLRQLRSEQYNVVVNLQRHARSGWITIRAGAPVTVGFEKNPLSMFFTKRVKHYMDGRHEIERNHELVSDWTGAASRPPRLYPTKADFHSVAPYVQEPYVCIAPTSVWFTKQYPAELWVRLIAQLKTNVWLLGGTSDVQACDAIVAQCNMPTVRSLAGQLSILQSAALISQATMTYANDSAAMHLASAVNAPVTAIFCSTVPRFGFGPLSDVSFIVESTAPLPCRPCGIHGLPQCPQKHFRCATTITAEQIIEHR